MTPQLRFPQFTDEWRKTQISDVAEKGEYGMNAAAKPFDGVNKYLRITDIDDETRRILAENITSPSDKLEDKYLLKQDDIVIARTGASTGKSYLYSSKDGKMYFAGFLIRFRVIKASPCFVYLQTLRKPYDKWIAAVSARSGQPGVNAEEYSTFSFYAPSIGEQEKIADFLTAVDERIEKIEKKLELLQQYKKGLMQKIFTQQIRFKDKNGTSYPEWEEKAFSELIQKITESHNSSNSSKKFETIELESLSQGTGKLLRTFPSSQQKSIKTKFQKGDVLYGKLRPYLRKFYYADFDGVCTSEIWVLRAKYVTNIYLYYLVQTDQFGAAVDIQSGSKMPRADWKTVSNEIFTIPSKEEQQKIAASLTALDDKIKSEQKRLTAAKQWKKGLLQKMFI